MIRGSGSIEQPGPGQHEATAGVWSVLLRLVSDTLKRPPWFLQPCRAAAESVRCSRWLNDTFEDRQTSGRQEYRSLASEPANAKPCEDKSARKTGNSHVTSVASQPADRLFWARLLPYTCSASAAWASATSVWKLSAPRVLCQYEPSSSWHGCFKAWRFPLNLKSETALPQRWE